jgi:hypothetical protein
VRIRSLFPRISAEGGSSAKSPRAGKSDNENYVLVV